MTDGVRRQLRRAAELSSGGTEQRVKEGRRWRLLLLIDGKETSGVDSSRTNSPRSRLRVTARESGEEGQRQAAVWRRWQADGGDFDFWIIYIIATEFILQITLNFSKEVENLQKWKLLNFSNSTTLLKWTFSNSTSIFKFEYGVHLSIWIISKLLKILYVNLKNFEYQSWSL